MTMQAEMSEDGRVLTVSLPFTMQKRGGRKRVVTADGTPVWARKPARIDSTLVKAIARAHRRQRMLDDGMHGSTAERAAAERINPSYLARVLRLTLLAPEIVEAVLDGTAPQAITLELVMRPFTTVWDAHRF